MTDFVRRFGYATGGGFVIAYMAGSILAWVVASIGLYVLMTVWGDSGPTQM
jgi:hypothetical protein